jgi:hypothetical protein
MVCTGRTAHRGSRGIALLFFDHVIRRGEGSVSRPGRSLPSGKTRYPLYRRLGGPRGGMDKGGKSGPKRNLIPGPSSPLPFALPGPHKNVHSVHYFVTKLHALVLHIPMEFLTVPQYSQASRLQANFRRKRIQLFIRRIKSYLSFDGIIRSSPYSSL